MISYIIPAHNEEHVLGRTLRALQAAAAAAGDAEVVVVDDASTDRTSDIARQHGARVVQVAHRHIAKTRNAGARVARGEYLVFVDADTLVNTALLRAALRTLRRGAVGGGSAFRFDGWVPLYARLLLPLANLHFRLVGIAPGFFMFCERQAFEQVGGFDEKVLAAEDMVLSFALKRLGPFVMLHEIVRTSGRKLRTHSPGEVWRAYAHVSAAGPAGARDRHGLDFWYGERRQDPMRR